MIKGEELALAAMEKEHERLSKIAVRAKAEADEAVNVGSEMLAIHEEYSSLLSLKEYGTPETIKKAGELSKRAKRARKIMQKDLIKLLDKQSEAEFARDDLKSEIEMYKFRNNLRRGYDR